MNTVVRVKNTQLHHTCDNVYIQTHDFINILFINNTHIRLM